MVPVSEQRGRDQIASTRNRLTAARPTVEQRGQGRGCDENGQLENHERRSDSATPPQRRTRPMDPYGRLDGR